MDNQIGPVVFGCLSAIFAAYGLRELALAFKTPELSAWYGRALPGAGSVFLAVLFADMIVKILG